MKTMIKILSTIIISVISITGYTYAETSTQTVNGTDSISYTLNTEIYNILNELDNRIYNSFKTITLKNNNFFLENGVWYTYTYNQYKNFGKSYKISEKSLKNTGLNTDTTLLILDDTTGASFVTDYKKVKLISNYIIEGITNKQEFLNQLVDDKKYLHADTDELFLRLQAETTSLTKGLSKAGKIYVIYNYILENISYSKTFNTSNKEIFSGINTYENNIGICGGYSKLNLYMLSFAGISDVEVKTGYVLDSPVFPNVGHAWIRIGDKYYDPTYDDPIGASKTRAYSQYKYFGLPRDLFYANKFDYGTIPSYLKTETLASRKNLIKENLSKLTDKYENKNYILLRPYTFRKINILAYNEKITIETVKNIIPSYEVNNYKYTVNNKIKTITNLKYYTVNDSNIEKLLKQLNYNLDGYQLLEWDNGIYRLSYNITTNELAYNY